METTGDPNDPVRYKMILGQEALDEALTNRGLVPCELYRAIVIQKIKSGAWRSVETAVDELAAEMEKGN